MATWGGLDSGISGNAAVVHCSKCSAVVPKIPQYKLAAIGAVSDVDLSVDTSSPHATVETGGGRIR